MAAKIGLWLDERQAVIVSVTNMSAEITKVKSAIKDEIHAVNNVSSNSEARQDPAAARRNKIKMEEVLGPYYDAIIDNIWSAGEIVIFGAGDAKYELKNRLGKNNLARRIVVFEDADKMADDQIMDKVRQYSS
ncbi:MAG: hypothetical protein CVU54_08140 [Deltaproteobacteria bacterium HGW-Deltaproteobacteria-12]|jgi:hypothetical protein|nr:MAG: hypothetical protein CVU54_08140 [Deltaproteobacteria bacterium HGW-Deltaproteobacteria-12]